MSLKYDTYHPHVVLSNRCSQYIHTRTSRPTLLSKKIRQDQATYHTVMEADTRLKSGGLAPEALICADYVTNAIYSIK